MKMKHGPVEAGDGKETREIIMQESTVDDLVVVGGITFPPTLLPP